MAEDKLAERKTLPFRLQDEIRRRIVRGRYLPGQPLREQDLELQLGCSRSPVRDALRLLLQTGLVEHEPWRGFRVQKYSAQEMECFYRLRAMIEGMLIDALVAVDVTLLVDDLNARLERLEAAFHRRDLNEYFDENVALHTSIAAHSGMTSVAGVLDRSINVTLPVRYRLMQTAFPNRSTFEAHGRIVEKIAARDFVAARTLTETHILEDLEDVKLAVAGPGPEPRGDDRLPEEAAAEIG